MGQQGMTKRQSTILQGIAVLLMLYHHFYNDPLAFGGRLAFFQIDLVQRAAWFGKICVGMFAFVSGYGMCRVLEKKKDAAGEFWELLLLEYRISIRQIARVLIKYWAVLLIVMSVVFATGGRSFEWKEFLTNFFCIYPSYNGAFWYMGQYIRMLLLLPFMDLIFQTWQDQRNRMRKRIFFGAIAGFLGVVSLAALFGEGVGAFLKVVIREMRVSFIITFFVGYLIARFRIYEMVSARIQKIGAIGQIVLGLFLIAAVCFFRMGVSDSAAYAKLDFLFLPFWTFGLLCVLEHAKILSHMLYGVGALSTYMWLLHLHVRDFSQEWLLQRVQSHLLYYGIQVLLSATAALLFWSLERAIHRILKK